MQERILVGMAPVGAEKDLLEMNLMLDTVGEMGLKEEGPDWSMRAWELLH